MTSVKAIVFETEGNEQNNSLTMNQVWNKLIDGGMKTAMTNEKCNYFNDIVPHKSATFICNKEQLEDVKYWISYCGCSISKTLVMPDGKMVLRADYQCW